MIRPEDAFHVSVAQALHYALTLPTWWSTIGHGSYTSKREAALLKRKGLRRGVPDIIVFHPMEEVRRRDHAACCRYRIESRRRSPD